MGCAQSKIENEEAVTRCKERKQFMKDAVTARNAFAAAHSAYAMALKNTGAALSDYTHGEFLVSGHSSSGAAIASTSSLPIGISPPSPSSAAAISNSAGASSSASSAIPQPITDTLPPPPPPPLPPLQRAATMPEMNGRSGVPSGNGLNGTIIEEDGTLDDDDDSELENHDRLVRKSKSRGGSNRGRTMIDDRQEAPPPPPPQSVAANSRPIPPSRQHHHQQPEPYFDYFFPNVDNMPGTTLEDTPPPPPQPQPQPQPQAKPAPPQPTSPSTEEDEEEEEEDEDEEEEETVVEREQPVEEMLKRVEEPRVDLEKAANFRGMKKSKGKAIAGERRGGRPVTTNLANVFIEIDDNFLKASESAHEVSKMLEATRLHYHSNFADNRGHIDHSARVMRVITWNRSFRGIPNTDDAKDDFDSAENETHATVLDKLLAWEKKLYDEVKAGELMKIEYQKKVAHLNRVKKRGGHSDSLERAKAAALMLLGPTMNAKVAFELSERIPHLGLRMREHSRRAQVYAGRMRELGIKVIYPGLEDHPQHKLARGMVNTDYGYGGLLSIDMETEERANKLMTYLQNATQFGLMAVSLGYYETLMSCSGSSTSSELDPSEKAAAGISPGLVRMSVGYVGTLEQKWTQFEKAFLRM